MSDQLSQYAHENKSGVGLNLNPRMITPHFEKGDEAQMMVVETTKDGERSTEYRHFIIRAKRQKSSGHWEYQLNEKDTGEPYKGNEWFSEGDLEDV